MKAFIAIFILSCVAGKVYGQQFSVNDDLVKDFLGEVKNTTEAAVNYRIDANESVGFSSIVDNAVDTFEDHVQRRGDVFRTDDNLGHFISEGRRFRQRENRFNCRFDNSSCFRNMYQPRFTHINGCNICNGFMRNFARSTPIRPIPFSPRFVSYGGTPLRTFSNGVIFNGERCPLVFDTDDDRWYFNYNNQSLFPTF